VKLALECVKSVSGKHKVKYFAHLLTGKQLQKLKLIKVHESPFLIRVEKKMNIFGMQYLDKS
jgi:hypothetical protein